jgi:hypothetical protein
MKRTTEKQLWYALVYLCEKKHCKAINVPRKIRDEMIANGTKPSRFAMCGKAAGMSLECTVYGWSLHVYTKGHTSVARVSHFEACTAREMWERICGVMVMNRLRIK